MKAISKVSILSYIKSFILFRLFNIKSKFYYLLLCSSAPLLLGFPNVASATEQQIAQAIPVGINRPSLKVGSQGEIVSELQAALKLLGYYNGAVDGKFNDATATAVLQFKQAAGLSANSVVDAPTWQRLFPGETNVASNTPLPSPTRSGFPIPTQTADDLPRPVVISNRPAPSPEPRPVVSRNNGNAQQLETVRPPSTTRANATNRVSSTRPVQNTTSTSATTRTSTTNRSGRTNNSSTTSATSTTTTNRPRRTNDSSNSSTSSRTRTNNSSTNTSNTTRQKPAIQYTAAGLPILRLGMRGEEVLELQEKLQRFGYLKSNPDGDFGAETEAAVKALQERHGMEPDGVAGGATWDILNRRRNRSQS